MSNDINDILELMKKINSMALNLHLDSPNIQSEPSDSDAYEILMESRKLFKGFLLFNGIKERIVDSMLRKFNDAGRRSPPWLAGSQTGNRRPQDGADGNRRNRWLFPKTHDYYATKSMGCLVELRFVLQTLSMLNAPKLPSEILKNSFVTILQHELMPRNFLDPLTKQSPDFNKFVKDRRYIESGHVVPHAKSGKHNYKNATLMLRDSNRQQADYTIDECIRNMVLVLSNHGYNVEKQP
ncbi:MAG: hypothetical protein IH841_08720 [Thaumarchaeota archaeon]|nr:hypothetical protein [Nitrososphaerota archaeon]